MTKPIRWTLIGVIVLIIIGMIAYPRIKHLFTSGDNDQGPPNAGAISARRPPIAINAVVVNIKSITDNINAVGTSIPDEQVDLSFESSGKITDIFFTEGSHVKKGELLAKINDKPLQAELKKLEAQVPLAEARVFRQKTLLSKEAVSQEAYEQVTTALDILMADIELIKSRIIQTELRAPFDGIVGLRKASEGAYATPQTVIVNLTKISPLKIEFSINERYVTDVASGTDIHFEMDDVSGQGHQYSAKVYAVESQIGLETRTLKVRALFPNSKEEVLPGRYLSINIITKEIKDAITVPSEAVIPEMGKSIVYLYKNGVARATEISRGLRTEKYVQVLDGLNPGDTVITTGVMQMRTGMNVKIENLKID